MRRLRALSGLAALLLGSAALPLVAQDAAPLVVTLSDSTPIAPTQSFELRWNRALAPEEGRVAIFLGALDVTGLFELGSTGARFLAALPLATGEAELTIYMVSPAERWRPLARFALRVGALASAEATPAPALGSTPTAATRLQVTPALTLNLKSQPAEAHFPDANAPPRPTYADASWQAGLQATGLTGNLETGAELGLVGSSYRPELLRFGEKGNSASRLDLSNYLIRAQAGRGRLQLGHVSTGSSRHLINNFSSRGVTLSQALGARGDLSFGFLNGSSIVGWDNLLGVARHRHRMISGTLGLELLPRRPGGVRLEAGGLDGSLLPQSGVNQGVANDAEKSRGWSLRLIASDPSQRLRLETGLARSRFSNPFDPELSQGVTLVPVRPESRTARYVDASVGLLRNLALSRTWNADLDVSYRHERVDPLFRSVAAFAQADRLNHQFELTARVGPLSATAGHLRSGDNLDAVASILTTLTRQETAGLTLPVAGFFSRAESWMPRLSYAVQRTHQFGTGIPPTSELSAVHIPNQLSSNQTASADWQGAQWRAGYRFNRSFQDNRQPGRDSADLRNLVHSASLGVTPSGALDLGAELSSENAHNYELDRVSHVWRVGLNANLRLLTRASLAALFSHTVAGDREQLSSGRNTEWDVSGGYQFTLGSAGLSRVRGQLSLRYSRRAARMENSEFDLTSLTRVQTFTVGMNLVFF